MKLHSTMRYTYSLGWLFGALAILYRIVERLFPGLIQHVPVTSRGMLFFGGFLFVCTIATGIYCQVMRTEEKPVAGTASRSAAA